MARRRPSAEPRRVRRAITPARRSFDRADAARLRVAYVRERPGPGHHGIYWWTQWLAEEGRYVRNSHGAFHYDPFWLDLAEAGRKVAVFDVPYTPAVRRPGVWTANGWGLHDEMEPVSYPERLLQGHPQAVRAPPAAGRHDAFDEARGQARDGRCDGRGRSPSLPAPGGLRRPRRLGLLHPHLYRNAQGGPLSRRRRRGPRRRRYRR